MKIAIIGTGRIVNDALYAMSPLDTIEKRAILARPHSIEKGRALAEKYSIPDVYTDYAELLEKTDADTVYIGVINSVHYTYAKQALLAGKNVILEKAFTGYAHEAEELAALARENGLKLLEAITVLHGDLFDRLKASVGEIGSIRLMTANYSQFSSRYDDYLNGKVQPAFDRLAMGGCLYDITVYCIHYAVALFGEPVDVQYYPNIGWTGVDTSGAVMLKYDGFTCVCLGAKDSDGLSCVSIQGEKGQILAEGKPNSPSNLRVTRVGSAGSGFDANGGMIRNIETENFSAPTQHHRMTREFADFARIIDTDDRETADALLSESVGVMRVLEKARISGGISFE